MSFIGIPADNSNSKYPKLKDLVRKNAPSTSGNQNKKPRVQPQTIKYNVNIQNRYDSLSEDSTDDEGNLDTTQQETHKAEKIPPIVLYSYLTNHTQSLDNLKRKLKDDFVIKHKNNRVIFYTNNKEDHKIVMDTIQNAKLPCHTFTLPDEKKHRLVLKGLPPSITENEVLLDLQKIDIPVCKVSQMKLKKDGIIKTSSNVHSNYRQ